MKSVVLLSGGIDSTVLLADRIAKGDDIVAVSFDYAQRNVQREVIAARNIATYYGITHSVVTLPPIFSDNALTGDIDVPCAHADEPDDTVVPGRNLVMLSIAVAIAESVGATQVLFGATKDDRAGYPDCRSEFVTAFDDAAYQGSGKRVRVAAPFVIHNKADIILLGEDLNAPLWMTWSCYHGNTEPCRTCGACRLRTEAYQ